MRSPTAAPSPSSLEIAGESEPWLSAEAAEGAIDERTAAIIAVCYGGHPARSKGCARWPIVMGSLCWRTPPTAAAHCTGERPSRHLRRGGGIQLLRREEHRRRGGWNGRHRRRRAGSAVGAAALAWDLELGLEPAPQRLVGLRRRRARLRLLQDRRPPVCAGLGSPAAFEESETARRAEIDAAYRRDLAGIEGIEPTPPAGPDSRSSHLLFTVVLEGIDRHRLRAELAERGVQTSVHFRPAHELTLYSRPELELPLTESYGRRCVSLPDLPEMEEWQRELVVESIPEVLRADAPEPAARIRATSGRRRRPAFALRRR